MLKNFLIAVCMVALMAAPAFATFGGDAFDSGSNFEGVYGINTSAIESDTNWNQTQGAQAFGVGSAGGEFEGMQGLGAGISAGLVTVTAINQPNMAHSSGIVANGVIGFVTPHTEYFRIFCWSFPYQTNSQSLSGSGSLLTTAVKGDGVASTYGSFAYGAHNDGGLIVGAGITGGLSNVKSSNGGHTTTVTAVSGTGSGAFSMPMMRGGSPE